MVMRHLQTLQSDHTSQSSTPLSHNIVITILLTVYNTFEIVKGTNQSPALCKGIS